MPEESDSGLHTLIDPLAEDVSIVILLNDFISHVLERSSQGHVLGNQKFLCHTSDFLTYLQDYYSRNAANNCLISDILSQLRQLLVIISETVYVSCTSCICEDATEKTLTVPRKTQSQLRELSSRVNNVTDTVVVLQSSTHDFLHKSVKMKYPSIEEEDHMVAMAARLKQVIDHLEGCEFLMSAVLMAVKEKAMSEKRFFNTSSLAIGAVCAGRFAWQLFKGVATEELVSTGIWAGSIGMSAVFFQIPRMKMSDVLDRLDYCEREYQKMKKISKDWKLSNNWSYARLVCLPSPINNVRFSLN